MMHQGQEAEGLWKKFLADQFYLTEESDMLKTLQIAPPRAGVTSIFGVPIADSVLEAPSAFEAWKYWLKCSGRFYSDGLRNIEDKRPLLHGPYFLRAAALWKKLFAWLDGPDCGEVGERVKRLLSRRGMFHRDWSEARNEPGIVACQAVYSFCQGPEAFEIMTSGVSDAETKASGLLGGSHAYGFASCTHLIRPKLTPSDKLIIAMDPFAMHTGARKMFCVDLLTGKLELHYDTNFVRPAITAAALDEQSKGTPIGHDAVLLWLEEYSDRVSTGRVRVDHIGDPADDAPRAIMQYPQLPIAASPVVTDGIQAVSRVVTRGVEVVASSVYLPQTGEDSNLGFIYNIRIRLLTPENEDFVSAADRGFETCQLLSRHWRIANHDIQRVEQVDGEGVIGMYPLLREGGYQFPGIGLDDGEDFDGTFSYTSCTRAMQGSFSGTIQFVPGSLRSPTGPAFAVELRPFALDNNPAFLY
jgi:uncharacterized protein affecting Mg2+/Co2+ transport